MKKIISLLLLLSLAFSLLSCDGLFNKQDNTSETTTSEEQQTTPDETTSGKPDAPVNPDAVGFQMSIRDGNLVFRALIQSDNANAYITLECFFNERLSHSYFGEMSFDEALKVANFFVDGKLAGADTAVFNGSTVCFGEKNSLVPPAGIVPGEPDTPDAPIISDTSIDPEYVGLEFFVSGDGKFTFCAFIASTNANTYITLESFFNNILSPSMFDGVLFDQTLDSVDWFVNDILADANSKVFSGNVVTFAAKDTPTKPPVGDGEDGEEDGKIKIVFYHTMSATNLQPVLEDAIERFNRLYPNIIIEHQQIGDYDSLHQQIKTDLLVGEQPNIAYCYPDHVALYNVAGAVVPLDQLISSTYEVTRADGSKEIMGFTQDQIDDFIEGFYDEGRQFGNGQMYTLPLSKSTEVLYYNKTFFDEHNLKVPTTWDEMEEVCRQIKAIDPNSIPLGYDSESNWFITMCEQYGSPYTSTTGDHYLFDNETNWNFMNRFASWYAEGLVTTQELLGAYTSEDFKKADGEAGKIYISIGSSAGAYHQRPDKVGGEYPFEVGIAPIPQVDANNPKVISRGPSLCIFNKANEEEVVASWLFVKFLTTDVEFQAAFSMTAGYIPVIKSVQDYENYKLFLSKADGGDNIQALSAMQCLAQMDAYFTLPAFNGSSKARDEVGLLLQTCFAGYEGAADKMKMIQEAFDKAIEECNY